MMKRGRMTIERGTAVPGLIGCVYGLVGLASLGYFVLLGTTLVFYRPALGFEREAITVILSYVLSLF